jgi:hypothetical protein
MTNRPFCRDLVCVVAIALMPMLVSCNRDSSGADAGGSKSTEALSGAGLDPCSLITQAEAEAALGLKAEGPQKDSGFGQFAQCQYTASGERVTDVRSATVQVHPVDFASKRKAFADAGEKIEPIAGIGDAAFWAPGYSFLYVQKSKLTAAFAVHRQEADLLKASIELARNGLRRMP